MIRKSRENPDPLNERELERIQNLVARQYEDYTERTIASFSKSPITLSHILLNLDDIKEEELKFLLTYHFDDKNVVDAIRIIFGALFIATRKNSSYNYYQNFIKIVNILGQGVQGVVSSAEFGPDLNNVPTLAVKGVSGNHPLDLFSLQREFMVGWQLASLFKETPIFSQVIALVSCSGIITDKKDIVGFCEKEDVIASSISLMVEGKSFQKTQLTGERFFKLFLMVLDGLKKASRFEYVHYDLHYENVFCRKLPFDINFTLNLTGRDEYLYTNEIPVVLDYGLSRITTPNGEVSYPTYFKDGEAVYGPKMMLEHMGISSSYSPLHDVYKLFFFTVYGQPDLLRDVAWMARYFYSSPILPETPKQIREEHNFILPPEFRNDTLQMYIDWMVQQPEYRNYLLKRPFGKEIYGQVEKINVFERIGVDLNKYHRIDDSYEWYIYKNFNTNQPNRKKILEELRKLYPKNYNSFLDDLDEAILFARKNKNIPADEKSARVVMAELGNYYVVIENERLAQAELANDLGYSQKEADQLYSQWKRELIPYQRFYQRNEKLMFGIIYPL